MQNHGNQNQGRVDIYGLIKKLYEKQKLCGLNNFNELTRRLKKILGKIHKQYAQAEFDFEENIPEWKKNKNENLEITKLNRQYEELYINYLNEVNNSKSQLQKQIAKIEQLTTDLKKGEEELIKSKNEFVKQQEQFVLLQDSYKRVTEKLRQNQQKLITEHQKLVKLQEKLRTLSEKSNQNQLKFKYEHAKLEQKLEQAKKVEESLKKQITVNKEFAKNQKQKNIELEFNNLKLKQQIEEFNIKEKNLQAQIQEFQKKLNLANSAIVEQKQQQQSMPKSLEQKSQTS